MTGWIKLYRQLLEKAIWKKSTPEQKVILVTLLLMANHEESEWEWEGKKFTVNPGQFITSLDSIRKECGKGISLQNVRTALNKFKKYEFLTNESTKTGRLVTILNWPIYQGEQILTNKESNKDLTKRSQRPNKDLTSNKNDKNDKNDKNINISSKEDIVEQSEKSYTPYAEIQKLFNSTCTTLPNIRSIDGARKTRVKKLWQEQNDLEFFKELFKRVDNSDFLSGRNGKWDKCCFDWIIKPANLTKILEGNYDNRNNTSDVFKRFLEKDERKKHGKEGSG